MLWVDDHYQTAFRRLGWRSVEPAARHFLGDLRKLKNVQVVAGTLPLPDAPPLPVFYKQYSYPRPGWRFWGRQSKARREFHNYRVFTELDIPCARRIACGEERDRWGRLRRAFILTEAIPGALPLHQFLEQHGLDADRTAAKAIRRPLIIQLATRLRRLHQGVFHHNDLFWRNVLVTWSPPDEPQLWWIDCPRGGRMRWPLRRHQRIKDLASLDKLAGQLCRPRERVLFVKHYLDLPRLDAGAKELIRATLRYGTSRWPEE